MFSVRQRPSRNRNSRLGFSTDHDDLPTQPRDLRSSASRDAETSSSFTMVSGPSSLGTFSTLSAITTTFDHDPSPSSYTPPFHAPHHDPPPSRRRASEVPRKFFSVAASNPLRKAMKLSGILAEIPASPVDENPADFTPCSVLDFSRREIPARQQQRQRANSTLTKLMHADPESVPSVNPFAEYAGVAASPTDRQHAPMKVRVYFPNSQTPHDHMSLTVGQNASVRDLIGLSLWTYCQEKWAPSILAGKSPEDLRATLNDLPQWRLFRIKKDGQIDYEHDPDWWDKLQYLGANREYAIMKIPSSYSSGSSPIPPRPIETKPKRRATLMSFTPPDTISESSNHRRSRSTVTPAKLPSSELKSLKIVFPQQFAVVVEASPHGRLKHVIESVCRERSIEHPEEFVFLFVNPGEPPRLISLDEMVANIGARGELVLIRRTILPPSSDSKLAA